MTDTVLVINSGSSSIKYQLINPDNGDAIAKGLVERIGESEGHIQHKYGEKVVDVNEPIADHEVGMREVLRLFDEVGPSPRPTSWPLVTASFRAVSTSTVRL